MLDANEDRLHHTKWQRPIAAGFLSATSAILLAGILSILGLGLSIALLPLEFTACLVGYICTTSIYSVTLKKMVMIDVIVLSLLYTLRVIAGSFATGIMISFWLLGLSIFLFFSLALIKRYIELTAAINRNEKNDNKYRGYTLHDTHLLGSLGSSAGYVAVLILGLYIQDPKASALYSQPEIIWAACPILLYWISRTWLIAHRGKMHDDPIVFALRDKTSLICLMLNIFILWLAL